MALVVDRVSPPSHSSEREDKSKVSRSTYTWLHRVVQMVIQEEQAGERVREQNLKQERSKAKPNMHTQKSFTDYNLDFISPFRCQMNGHNPGY